MFQSIKAALASVVVTLKSSITPIVAATTATLLLGGSIYYYTIKDGIYEKQKNNIRYVIDNHISNITIDSIVENGRDGYAYATDLDEIVEDIIEELEKEKITLKSYTGKGREKAVLRKLIKAEIISLYPDLRSAKEIEKDKKVPKNEVQGGIKIVKNNSDEDPVATDDILEYDMDKVDALEYMPYKDFKKLISDNDEDAKKYFSIKPSTLNSVLKGDIVVKTDEPNAAPEVTREELEKIIEEGFDGEAQSNLESVIDALLEIQEVNKVNPLFAIAVTKKESSCGTAWAAIDKSTYNWISIKSNSGGWMQYDSFSHATKEFAELISNSSNYFGGGNYSVVQISQKYCVPPEEWANGVNEFIIEMYDIIGKKDDVYVDGGSANSSGGSNNILEKARSYLDMTGNEWSEKTGYYSEWCANFVTTIYNECEVFPTGVTGGNVVSDFKKGEAEKYYHSRESGYEPKLGDAILIDWDNDSSDGPNGYIEGDDGLDGVPDHMGIFAGINEDGTINTIEGNTGVTESRSWQNAVVHEYEGRFTGLDDPEILGYFSVPEELIKDQTTAEGSGGDGSNVIEKAESYIGMTGSEWFDKTGYDGEWCANFVTTIYEECNIFPAAGKGGNNVSNFKDGEAEEYYHAKDSGYEPKAGDAVLYEWGSDDNPDHVGIFVEKNEDGTITAIEGNTGDAGTAETREVMERQREESVIAGYFSVPSELLKGGSKDKEAISIDIVIATSTTTTTKVETVEYIPKDDGSGDEKKVSTTEKKKYTLKESSITYQGGMAKYSMPAGFLWSLLVMGENVNFVTKLADLAINETKIILEAQDSDSKTVNVSKDSYTKQKEITRTVTAGDGTQKQETVTVTAKKPSTVTTTVTTENSNTNLNLTYANTWVAIYNKIYEKKTIDDEDDEITDEDLNWEDLEDEEGETVHTESEKPDKDKEYKDLRKQFIAEITEDKCKTILNEYLSKITTEHAIYYLFQKDTDNVVYNNCVDYIYNYIKGDFAEVFIENHLIIRQNVQAEIDDFWDNRDATEKQFFTNKKIDKDGLEDILFNTIKKISDDMSIIETAEKDVTDHHIDNKNGSVTLTSNLVVYTSAGEKVQERVEVDKKDNFVTYFKKSGRAKEYILDTPDWVYEMLETQEKTANMLDLFKYLLYRTNGEYYGVILYNFNIFDVIRYNGIQGLMGTTIQEKVWFALRAAGYSEMSTAAVMGYIHTLSRFDLTRIEPGKTEETGGIGIGEWKDKRKEQLKKFAESKEKSWKDAEIQAEFLKGELSEDGGADDFATFQLADFGRYKYKEWAEAEDDEEELDKSKLREITRIFYHTYTKSEEIEEGEDIEDTEEDVGLGDIFGNIKENFQEMQEERLTINNIYKWALRYYRELHGKAAAGGEFVENSNYSSDGIYGTFTNSITGRTHIIVNQNHSAINLPGQCNRATAMSIASGYRKTGESDSQLLATIHAAGNYVCSNATTTNAYFNQYGLEMKMSGYEYSPSTIRTIMSQGGYIAVYFKGAAFGKSGKQYSRSGSEHWVAIIGYGYVDGKEQIFISDPGFGSSGWRDIDEFDACKAQMGYFHPVFEK